MSDHTCEDCGADVDEAATEDSQDLYDALGIPEGEYYCDDCLAAQSE